MAYIYKTILRYCPKYTPALFYPSIDNQKCSYTKNHFCPTNFWPIKHRNLSMFCPPFVCDNCECFLSAGLSASRSCPEFLPAYCPLWCAPVVTKSMILREPFYRVTSPEVIPLAAGHSIFKVLCLLTRTSLPKKGGCSRMSKTLE